MGWIQDTVPALIQAAMQAAGGCGLSTSGSYYQKGSNTPITAYSMPTRASRFAVDFHNALNIQIRRTEIAPAQGGIDYRVGDRYDKDGVTYCVNLVEDVSGALAVLYRLSLVAPEEVRL